MITPCILKLRNIKMLTIMQHTMKYRNHPYNNQAAFENIKMSTLYNNIK